MNSAPHSTVGTRASALPSGPQPRHEVRLAVKDLLLQSKAFAQLPPALQQQIAHDTTQIADYLAAPQGVPGHTLPTAQALLQPPAGGTAGALDWLPQADPSAAASKYSDQVKEVDKIGKDSFKAGAAREGAKVAGMFMKSVNFPKFVSSLIKGVFHAIVEASMEQMEAYGNLVKSVAQSLDSFRDENVSANQGRDHLVDQFPDVFQLGVNPDDQGNPQPRLQLRDGVDEDAALKQINSSSLASAAGPMKSLDLEDEDNERRLVEAARTHVATGRQQLLATMVLMGINRIVVTDGKISAKIMYDFQAHDTMKKRRSATAFDYARDQYGNVQKTYGSEGTYDDRTEGGSYSRTKDDEERTDASYYAKGTYKYTEAPIVTAMSTASETTDSALQTRAQLAGVVDVNFKSDYFPLEKMVDPAQIAQLQLAAVPGRGAAGKAAPAATPPAPAATTVTSTPPTGTTPAPTPAA